VLTILEALDDPKLFASAFAGATWRPWRVFLAALFGLRMNAADHDLCRAHTGRIVVPTSPAAEAFAIVGRRGGKSRVAALVAVFLACFRTYQLAPGERGVVMVIAGDRRQARVILRYVIALLEGALMLKRMIAKRTAESIELTNGISVEVHTASFRSTRGYTVVAAILDELAFWRTDDAAEPDHEVVAALRPGMATVPGSLLLGISSPYARRGVLNQAHRDFFGKDDAPTLVWQASTSAMHPDNPRLESEIARAYVEDPASAAAEYGALFRTDVEGYVAREAVDACVIPDRRELLPASASRYFAFTDPSGGSRDSFTLAVAHHEDGRAVLDAVRERRPPFSPEDVVAEFAAVLKTYRLHEVTGDRYGGEWPRERFREHGIEYRPSESSKSDLYGELLPLVNAGRAELLDDARLVAQLVGLERRTARGGRDSIDHAPGAHDDLANAAAGALVLSARAASAPARFVGIAGVTKESSRLGSFIPYRGRNL
jgi:hypothetical protein